MRQVMLILALLPAAASARDVVSPPVRAATRCRSGTELARSAPLSGATHRLTQEPPAALIAAVYLKVDGCPTPVVLREGIGSDAGAPRPRISADAQILVLR